MSYDHAPESQDPDDLRIASLRVTGAYPWLDPDATVPYGQVLYAAGTMGWSADTVVSRLTALGYADIERPEGPLPGTVAPEDARLVNAYGKHDHRTERLGLGTPVPLRHILDAAGRENRGPADVARRLTSFGYRAGTGHRPLPESPEPRDIVLTRRDRKGYGEWLDWEAEVSAQHVLAAGYELSCNPYTAAKRLVELGFRLPYTPEPADERILEYGSAAPLGHILDVAQEWGRTPADIVARLAAWGIGLSGTVLPDSPEPDDLRILSEELDGRRPWLIKNHVVGLQPRHILRASLATGRSPADIAERLTGLGHWLHENAKLPEVADEADIRLLATVDRSYLDNVHLEHVLRTASLTGRSPADVASRLTDLGYRLPDEVTYPEVRGTVTA